MTVDTWAPCHPFSDSPTDDSKHGGFVLSMTPGRAIRFNLKKGRSWR
jgi:hypothetical protein